MDEVLKQAPLNIDKETIQSIFIKNNENVLNTLIELWDTDIKKEPEIVEENKWEKIRDICDSYDKEMQKVMKNNIRDS